VSERIEIQMGTLGQGRWGSGRYIGGHHVVIDFLVKPRPSCYFSSRARSGRRRRAAHRRVALFKSSEVNALGAHCGEARGTV